MTLPVNEPVLSQPPQAYDARIFAQWKQAFEFFFRQLNNRGPLIATSLKLTDLPTSSSGLQSGQVWNDSGTLKIVP